MITTPSGRAPALSRRQAGSCPGWQQLQSGMSLLELLVAFVILAISITMLFRVSSSTIRGVAIVEREQEAAILAQSLLDLRDSVPREGWNAQGVSGPFQWEARSKPDVSAGDGTARPVLHAVSISVRWMSDDRPKRLEVSTLLPQSNRAPGVDRP